MEKFSDWLNQAENDLRWTMHNINGSFYPEAGFTAQQASEKALKYYLLSNGKELKKIHDLTVLIQDCMDIDQEFKRFLSESPKISYYYIESRYPPIVPTEAINKVEALEAYNFAQTLIEFIKEKINNF